MSTAAAGAQTSSVSAFYKGKSVTILVGGAVGGAFDVYGRLVARYLGRYIPGNPTIVLQNLPGGGGFRVGQRVAESAPQDGTSIALVHPPTLLDPIMGDPRKKTKRLDLAYLGSAAKNLAVCFVRADTKVKSFSELFEKQLIVGAGNDASGTREFSAILKNVLGAKLDISSGYKGNGEIFLAVDRGEVQGMCGGSYVGLAALRPNWLKDGFVKIIAQESIHGYPVLNAMKVPLTLDFAKTAEQRQILEVFYSQLEFGRPFVASAKVPAERVAALQKAFMKAMNDPDLLKEASAAKLDISPLSGPEVESLVRHVYSASPEIFTKIRKALGYI